MICNLQNCNAIGKSKCSRCKNAFYCSKEHQIQDWKNHKSVCVAPVVRTEDEELENFVDSSWFGQLQTDEINGREYFNFPSNEDFKNNLPSEPDDYFRCGWEISSLGFTWIISSYDATNNLLFGYVNLGNKEHAEYGSIPVDELRENFNAFKGTFKALYPCNYTFRKPVHRDTLKGRFGL
jgi:hypothetical protein